VSNKYVLTILAGGAIGFAATHSRGYPSQVGIVGGAVLGPLAVWVFSLVYGLAQNYNGNRCTYCRERMNADATACSHCGRSVSERAPARSVLRLVRAPDRGFAHRASKENGANMSAPEFMTYPDLYLIRTRLAVYVELLVTCTVTTVLVAVNAALSGDAMRHLSELLYLAVPLVVTLRILNHLARQEQDVREPDANMRFLFHLATLMPVVGYMPIVVFML
jgi:hypothetical protein